MSSVAVPDVESETVIFAYVAVEAVAVTVTLLPSSPTLDDAAANVTVGALWASTIVIVCD